MVSNNKNIDHLFRHQFGKMVSILTRIFGFEHLETIEDAIQDTFINAIKAWRNQMPQNPEAWLTAAAKNRFIDISRSIKSENNRKANYESGPAAIKIAELFLDNEIEDSQLRMIFTACHPILDPQEQIAFALKTISGFSAKEIATSLLAKEETIKKRLQRARKSIVSNNIKFEIPFGDKLPERQDRVLEVIYLIFNEGFHSNKKEKITRTDLCGEALRLCKLLLTNTTLRNSKTYALFALMCFHASRLESKVNEQNELINIRLQDRKKWHFPLIILGNEAMNKAVASNASMTSYHYEAAIASEHLRAPTFQETNWKVILEWYQQLDQLQPSINNQLNMAIVYMQMNNLKASFKILKNINHSALAQREYLYWATLAECHYLNQENSLAMTNLSKAIALVNNASEKKFLESKAKIYS